MGKIDKNYVMQDAGIRFGWLDGEFLPWEQCKIHMYCQVVRYGFRTFEGIRAYWNNEQQELYLFRVQDHLSRLEDSNKLMRISIPYTKADIEKIIVELFRKNEFKRDSYVQPSPYIGMGGLMASSSEDAFMGLMIGAVPFPSTEGRNIVKKACVSSWRRISDDMQPPRIKAGPNYMNSRFANIESRVGGYGNAIMLNNRGKVSEGLGTCVLMIRKGVPVTPPVTADILEGLTLDTIARLLKDEIGLDTVEREVDRTELYVADEVMLLGTGSEILALGTIDGLQIGNGGEGPITRKVRQLYFDAARGRNPKYSHWLTPVYRK
ncbi:MAG: branched-chain-amino-acid transaminase [Chloroflexi bacterium]|nr:branched-chain-amino-acid transaminase [Chloroflexota bacterium]